MTYFFPSSFHIFCNICMISYDFCYLTIIGLRANERHVAILSIHKKTTFELFAQKLFCCAIIHSSFDRRNNPYFIAVFDVVLGDFGTCNVGIAHSRQVHKTGPRGQACPGSLQNDFTNQRPGLGPAFTSLTVHIGLNFITKGLGPFLLPILQAGFHGMHGTQQGPGFIGSWYNFPHPHIFDSPQRNPSMGLVVFWGAQEILQAKVFCQKIVHVLGFLAPVLRHRSTAVDLIDLGPRRHDLRVYSGVQFIGIDPALLRAAFVHQNLELGEPLFVPQELHFPPVHGYFLSVAVGSLQLCIVPQLDGGRRTSPGPGRGQHRRLVQEGIQKRRLADPGVSHHSDDGLRLHPSAALFNFGGPLRATIGGAEERIFLQGFREGGQKRAALLHGRGHGNAFGMILQTEGFRVREFFGIPSSSSPAEDLFWNI
mmetsp:Transcript_30953/g.70753  ORF Transcript_30953/g.70753 Transcript_30953/m.70753 type:complete len:425 (-) Transcript_30953:773-2047(-)